MAEETHRSSAAEISVTSNGDLDQSPDSVFQRVRAHLEWSDTLGGKDVFRTRTLLRDGPCVRATHVGKRLRLLCGSSCKCIYRSLEKTFSNLHIMVYTGNSVCAFGFVLFTSSFVCVLFMLFDLQGDSR